MNRIGAFFQTQRQNHHIRLEDISTTKSIANLSRFERGEVDLSSTAIGSLAASLAIDTNDLVMYRVFENQDASVWGKVMAENWDEHKVLTLQASLRHLDTEPGKNPTLTMMVALLNELIRVHRVNARRFSPDIVEMIDQYTTNLSMFTRTEGILLQAAAEYVPTRVCQRWIIRPYQAITVADHQSNSLEVIRLISFCAFVATSAAEESDLEVMRGMIERMQKLLTLMPENPISQYNVQSVKALYACLCENTAVNRQRLVAVLKTTQVISTIGSFEQASRYMLEHHWLSAEDFACAKS